MRRHHVISLVPLGIACALVLGSASTAVAQAPFVLADRCKARALNRTVRVREAGTLLIPNVPAVST